MIDKELFKLLGKNKKYLIIIVFLMIIGLFFNISFSAMLALSIYYLSENSDVKKYCVIFGISLGCIIARYFIYRIISELKDLLGRNVRKDLREKGYEKIIALNGKTNEEIGASGITQVLMEGVDKLICIIVSIYHNFFMQLLLQ